MKYNSKIRPICAKDTELYQNIFDHAEAHGTAFSYIEYKETDQLDNIAVYDFGRGIPATLQDQSLCNY